MNWTWITIIAWIVVAIVDVLCIYVGYVIGRSTERKNNRSREEAIRTAARRDGCEWSADFWRKNVNKTDFDALYEGHWDTKESS